MAASLSLRCACLAAGRVARILNGAHVVTMSQPCPSHVVFHGRCRAASHSAHHLLRFSLHSPPLWHVHDARGQTQEAGFSYDSECLNGEEQQSWAGHGSSEEGEDSTPPLEPGPEDCCQTGCVRCVWDIYEERMEEYERRRAAVAAHRV